MGDEIHHFNLAKNIFYLKRRPAYDPLYGDPALRMPGAMYYFETPLWHIILAGVWKILDRISFKVAQFYQIIYSFLLLFFTYLLGNKLYSENEGVYSVLIVATIPAVILFSVLFYLDIPLTAFVVLCFLLFINKQFFWAGIIAGLGYLIKINFLFLLPSFIFLILFFKFGETEKTIFREKIKRIFIFIFPNILLMLPDLQFRYTHFPSIFFIKDPLIGPHAEILYQNPPVICYTNSTILNFFDIIKYFGIVLIGLFLYFLLKRFNEYKDLFLLIPIITYCCMFLFIFKKGLDLRYLLPIIPFLAILSSKSLIYLKKRSIKIFILIIITCVVQFIATFIFIYNHRRIPQGVKEAFQYVINYIPQDKFIMYPEDNITEYTGRKMQWGRFQYMPYLFWQANEKEAKNILLNINKTEYIMIKKTRIYDDTKIRHKGGYPKSFIEKLPNFSFLKLIFDNKEISIWKVEE